MKKVTIALCLILITASGYSQFRASEYIPWAIDHYKPAKDTIPDLRDTAAWKNKVIIQTPGIGKPDTISYGAADFYIGSSRLGVTYSDSLFNRITKWSDGHIDIDGDTMLCVSLLFSHLDKGVDREMELWEFVGAAVQFTNGVPDYWKIKKNNSAWPKYYGELKKLGYYSTPIKRKR